MHSDQFSLSVMAHPSRASQAAELCSRLSISEDAIAFDPFPDEPTSALPTAVAAWSRADPARHPWHVVLMDDAQVCRDFAAKVDELVATVDGPVSLYAEWGSRTGAIARAAHLMDRHLVPVGDPYVPTLGMALPAEIAVRFAETYRGRQYITEDVALGRFLAAERIVAHSVVPTLVEHDLSPSLIGNDTRGLRRSVLFRDDTAAPVTMRAWPESVTEVPYIRYQDLALHVLERVDGIWWKRGFAAWLHARPHHFPVIDRAVRSAVPQVRRILAARDAAFTEASCTCSVLIARYLAVLSMSVERSMRVPANSAQALGTLVPGTLRLFHDPRQLSGLGADLSEVLSDIDREVGR
ncbi:hypothetical protein AB0L62_17470 [Nocardia asteroides]